MMLTKYANHSRDLMSKNKKTGRINKKKTFIGQIKLTLVIPM